MPSGPRPSPFKAMAGEGACWSMPLQLPPLATHRPRNQCWRAFAAQHKILTSPLLLRLRSYHGFWPTDFYRVNPNFGTADELQQVLETLATHGMWNILDLVTNHVGGLGSLFHSHASTLPGTAPMLLHVRCCMLLLLLLLLMLMHGTHGLCLQATAQMCTRPPTALLILRSISTTAMVRRLLHFNNCDGEVLAASRTCRLPRYQRPRCRL